MSFHANDLKVIYPETLIVHKQGTNDLTVKNCSHKLSDTCEYIYMFLKQQRYGAELYGTLEPTYLSSCLLSCVRALGGSHSLRPARESHK